MRLYLVLIICTLFFGCKQKNSNLKADTQYYENRVEINNTENVATHYKTSKFNVAIFPKEYSTFFIQQKRFTPTKLEIDKAEFALAKRLKKINKNRSNQSSSPVIDENIRKYKRQYFGFVDENGMKYLLINSFWANDKDQNFNWLNEIVIVKDGGSYYWQIKYFIETDELKDLFVNGYS